MSRIKTVAIILCLTLVLACAHSAQTPPPKPLVLTGVTVIDVTGAAQPAAGVTVVIEGGRIREVGLAAKVKVPKGARVVNASGKYLIPGLWDMHVHLSWTKASALPVLVANGVTSVRDLGGRLDELDAWRTEIAAGLRVGPRILRAGPILNGRSFNPLQMVPGNPDETRGVIRALKYVGVDFIKVHRRMERDSYLAAIDEAKKQGLALVGHIPMTVTPEEASDAGQVTIEHTETLFEGTFSERNKDRKLPDAIRQFRDGGEAEKLFARFAKNGTVVTPTLVAFSSIIEAYDPALPPNPLKRYVALSYKEEERKRAQTISAEDLAETKATFAELKEVVRLLHKAGVTLMTGSDIAATRVPGFTLHDELALLVGAGLTPLEALRAATVTPARVMKKEKDLGTIEAGKLADLVLLDANPLDDIGNARRIRAVIVNGKLLDRAALDRLLAEAERDALKN
ncbi:MAG TPA: amidohydrolase family protein [Pyrinomonadaceae bacterium]|nr:amidohydrolase family protein [Pyrinomonadaceae bacterium]